jgi:hypothetical protein
MSEPVFNYEFDFSGVELLQYIAYWFVAGILGSVGLVYRFELPEDQTEYWERSIRLGLG